VLLYQLLAGTTPFVGTDEAIMYKIVYEPHKPLSEATRDPALQPFDAVLDQALAKNPDQRFPSALAMRTALLALATENVPDVLPAAIVLPPRVDGLAARPAHERDPSAPSGPGPASSPSAPNPLTPSKPPAGTSPPSVPVPTGWDAGALAEVERELAEQVGPVARVLVRRAARGLTSLAAVRQAVAGAITDFEARERFLARGNASRTRTGTGAGTVVPPGTTRLQPPQAEGATPDMPPGMPMREGDVDKAAAALLSSLGPIGRVVARRCAAQSQTREQFVAHVLEQLTPSVDARRVQADLWRALG
jgi:serine/threonine-protein kinase